VTRRARILPEISISPSLHLSISILKSTSPNFHVTMMPLQSPFRAATISDCYKIAELFQIASDGVSNYVWSTLTDDYPGLTLLEIGAKRYANEESLFSYKNCVIAENDREVMGMMLTFPIDYQTSQMEELTTVPVAEPSAEVSQLDVLAPYGLEAPGTWYICALALFPEYQGKGLGTQFLFLARQQARQRGYEELSLLCFEQNEGALRLYKRNGFKAIDRTPVVPHEMIHYTGDLLLMTSPA
jgi:ribosomal protein S18 acetylase RimI-like enzyme